MQKCLQIDQYAHTRLKVMEKAVPKYHICAVHSVIEGYRKGKNIKISRVRSAYGHRLLKIGVKKNMKKGREMNEYVACAQCLRCLSAPGCCAREVHLWGCER